jgi:hypothetical protein
MLNDPGQHDTIALLFDRHTWSQAIRFFTASQEKARRIKERIIKLERQLDDVVYEVETLEDESRVIFERFRSATQGNNSAHCTIDEGRGRSLPVAHSLVMHNRSDKFFDVYIDFAEKPFAIQQQMGLFLGFIAGGEPGGPSGLVAYRAESELLEFLKSINSRTKDPHKYIGNLVNDLKKELESAGFNRDLVQRNSQGVRFAWRRIAATLPGRRPPALVFRV